MVFDRQRHPRNRHATFRRPHPARFLECTPGFHRRAFESQAPPQPGGPKPLSSRENGQPGVKSFHTRARKELHRAQIVEYPCRTFCCCFLIFSVGRDNFVEMGGHRRGRSAEGKSRAASTEPAKSDKWRGGAGESNCIRRKKLRRKDMRNWCAALAMGALLALPLC